MDNMILCRCGHGIGSHEFWGCRVMKATGLRCGCRRNGHAILESAISDVRIEVAYTESSQTRRERFE